MGAPTTTLPRIIRFDRRDDAGEFGAASCPHCGAEGRYINWFTCDDGQTHGAMTGCIRLFPVSPIAEAHQKLAEKATSRRGLNSWDKRKLAAVEAFYDGAATETVTLAKIQAETASCQAWMRRKGYIR